MNQSTHTTNHDRHQAGVKPRVQGGQNLFFNPVIQPKLAINQPDDEHEREADAAADKVLRMQDEKRNKEFFFKPVIPQLQRKCAHSEEEEIQKKEAGQKTEKAPEPEGNVVQRKCAACEDEDKKRIQRKESQGIALSASSPAVEQTLQSSGHKLDSPTQSFMEQRFGHDFSSVQIHNDSLAHQSSQDIQAKAYTHQNHIAFGAGMYQPNTEAGKHLLAHELTHVVQQNRNSGAKLVQRKPTDDEEKKYPVEYDKLTVNVNNWDSRYKFFNLFVNTPYKDGKGVFPGSTPVAYANRVYELQLALKSRIKDYKGTANGILDDYTINGVYTLALAYQKDKNADVATGIDITVLERILHIKSRENKSPQPLYSIFDNYESLKLIMSNRAFVVSLGDRGEHVKILKEVLKQWNYLFVVGDTTNVYDNDTWTAVKQFQKDAGMDVLDGNVGYGTLHLMDMKLSGLASVIIKEGYSSFIQEFLSNNPAIFIDGDGDERKELKLIFGQSGNNVTVKVMHVDTKEVKGPFNFSFPGLALDKPVWITQQKSTEGVRNSEIKLQNAGKNDKEKPDEKQPDSIISIAPSPTVGDGSYKIGDQMVQFTPSSKIESASTVDYSTDEAQINPVLEVTLGKYGDVFRLFFKSKSATKNEEAKDGSASLYDAELNVIGVSQMNTVFKPAIPLKLKNAQLSLSVIESGLNYLAIDTDSDKEPDIKLYTRVTQRELSKDPADLRNVFILLTGNALSQEVEMGFGKRGNAYIFDHEDKSKEAFDQMVSARGEALLDQKKIAVSPQENVNQLSQLIGEIYLKALEENVINADTYLAWKKLDVSLSFINRFIKPKQQLTADDEEKINKAATFADEYFSLIKRDAKGKETTDTYSAGQPGSESSTTITSNPYTSEYEWSNDHGLVDRYNVKLGEEIRNKKWDAANRTFQGLSHGFNLWVADQLQAKHPDDKRVQGQTTGLFKYMTAVSALSGNPKLTSFTRVKALYFSYQEYAKQEGMPSIELPLYYYYDTDSEKWWIIDFINPHSPFKEEVSVEKNKVSNIPPDELFQKLNTKYHLPQGYILYTNPEGTLKGRVEMTEPWEAKDILTWAATILGGAALIGSLIFTGGADAPAVIPVLFALSAIAGGTAAAIDIYDHVRKEDYDPMALTMDVGTIAASIVGLGSLTSGKIVFAAVGAAEAGTPWAGNWAKLAVLADRYYVPLAQAGIGIDASNLAVMTADSIQKLEAIDKDADKYKNDNDRTRAKILLLSQLIFSGGITILSIKGSLPAMEGERNLVLMPGKDGVPVAVTPEFITQRFLQKITEPEAGAKADEGNDPLRGITTDKPGTSAKNYSLDGREYNVDFTKDLSGVAQSIVRKLESQGFVRVELISPDDLKKISQWFGKEIGVFQSPNYNGLRLVLGTENGILKKQIKVGEVCVVHTHPVFVSKPEHLKGVDLPSAGKHIEAVVDWSGLIIYFTKGKGILNPTNRLGNIEPMHEDFQAAFMNANGDIAGYAHIEVVVDAGVNTTKVKVIE